MRTRSRQLLSENTTPSSPKKKARRSRKSLVTSSSSCDEETQIDEETCYYPFENLEFVANIEETVRAVEQAVIGVMEKHHITYDVPIRNIATVAQKLGNNFATFKIDPIKRNSRMIEKNIDEALASFSDKDHVLDKKNFDTELVKYVLFGSTKMSALSADACLSVVESLEVNGASVLEYDSGCPAKTFSSMYKFYDTSEYNFKSLNEPTQKKMKKKYIEEALRYQHDVKSFLDTKYKLLKAAGNGDATDPLKDWPEGKLMEEQLAEAFKRNYEMGKTVKEIYEEESNKGSKKDVYWDIFRTVSLRGEIGARAKDKETELDQLFALTPLSALKSFSINSDNDKYHELNIPDFPTTMTKAKCPESAYSSIPHASIHQ